MDVDHPTKMYVEHPSYNGLIPIRGEDDGKRDQVETLGTVDRTKRFASSRPASPADPPPRPISGV